MSTTITAPFIVSRICVAANSGVMPASSKRHTAVATMTM
jgi:hypothetical protein